MISIDSLTTSPERLTKNQPVPGYELRVTGYLWPLVAGNWSLVSCHRRFGCHCHLILDTRFSTLDDLHLRTGHNVIEYRASSIDYSAFRMLAAP